MYKTTISGTVNTRQDEHQFDDASSARKSLDMGQDVHQPTFEDGIQTGVTIIPFHAVDVASFAYSTTEAPDPVDANCVERESGECETLYDGNVTFTYDENEGKMAGTFNMTGAFTEGATVNVTLDGGTASGTLEYSGGQLGAELSVGGNVVGVIFTVDGVTTILMPGVPGEPVSFPVNVEQCNAPERHVLFDGTVTIEGGEGEIELLAEMVEGKTVTGTFGEYNVSGIVVDNGGGALGVNLVFEGYTDDDYIEVDADGFVEINDYTLTIEDGDYQLKITMSGK